MKAKKIDLSPKSLNTTGKTINILATPNLNKTTLGMTMNIPDFLSWSVIYNKTNITEKGLNETDAQRELFPDHAKALADYALRGMATQRYLELQDQGKCPKDIIELMQHITPVAHAAFQPFTCNIRDCDNNGTDLNPEEIIETLPNKQTRAIEGVMRVTLIQSKHRLAIVDGQHRLVGFTILTDWLKSVIQTWKYQNFFHLLVK